MSRIALSTVGTLGDVIPFARLATVLAARGHRVTVQSWPQFASWFPREVAFVAAGGAVTSEDLHAGMDHALRAPDFIGSKRRFARMFYGLGDGDQRARDAYAAATANLAEHDLVVINILDHLAIAAAESLHLPWVSYASRPPPPLADADPLNASLDDEFSALLRAVTGRERRVRMFRDHSPALGLAACSPSLIPAWLPVAPHIDVTGAWLEAPSPAAPPLDGPAIFCTFGTMPDLHERTAALARGAAAAGVRAIIQVLVPAETPELPGVSYLRERVDLGALLPRVAAVVHHGSVGTLHEIVRAGVPSLVVPHMGDQFFWARAVEEARIGPAGLPHVQLSVPALAERMAALASFAPAARALAPRIAAEDGLARAVARIEGLL